MHPRKPAFTGVFGGMMVAFRKAFLTFNEEVSGE
jgi:hypothetical protein